MLTGIRKAVREDSETMACFNEAMALETEKRRLDPQLIRAGVAAMFDHPERGFYLVSVSAEQVVASLLVTYEWSDWRCATFWWIQSVYVSPAWRRRGIYARMYDYLRELAKREGGVCGFRLYAETNNAPAHATYRSCGMQPCRYVMFEST